MNAARRELFEGLGLSALATFFTVMFLIAAYVAIGASNWWRAAAFGIPGLIAAYWTVRFTRAQFAAYQAQQQGLRRGQ